MDAAQLQAVKDLLTWADRSNGETEATSRWPLVHAALNAQVPALDIDAILFKGRDMPERCKLERRVVHDLIAHCQAAGFVVHSVFDGDEETKIHGGTVPDGLQRDAIKAAMELVFNLDECSLRFQKPGKPVHGVYIVLGNDGWDSINDWNYSEGDADGFNACMEAFDATKYEPK